MAVGYVETPTRTFQASAALSQYRRVRLSTGKLAYSGASDADCVGTLEVAALAADEYVPVRLITSRGTQIMIASEAITQYASVYAAASGKVASSGTYQVGIALTASTADGDYIEVLVNASLIGSVGRASLTQDDLKVYGIELESLRVTATGALLGASAGTPAGAFGIAYGTHGTASPIVQGEAASGNVKTDKARFNFTMPAEYVDGQTVTLRVRCMETVGAATVSTTIDAEVYEHDGDGTVTGDICATAAIDVTDTVGDKDFTITPTNLAAGDSIDVELTGVTTDTGGTVGTILEIYKIQLLLDVKG